jgi:cytochrome c oxidase subunit 2
MPSWLTLPVQASTHARATDDIITAVHGLMAVLFVSWLLYFVYVLIRFRERAPESSHDGRTSSRTGAYVGVGLVIAQCVLLVGFELPALALRLQTPLPQAPLPQAGAAQAGWAQTDPSQATIVRVVAEQFAWNFHYAGPDGRFGRSSPTLISVDNPLGLDRSDKAAADDLVLLNELFLPDDKPVLIYLSSKDVIHSFSLPEMRVKQDAIPGMSIPIWFQPSRITPEGARWEVNCSQLCGLGHYRMRAFYRVMPRPAFDAWMREELDALLPQS